MVSLGEQRAGLLEHEVHLLQEAGYRVTGYSRHSGLDVIELIAPPTKSGTDDVRLQVTLPASYPLMAPRVVAPDLDMQHHQNPFAHDLCLLERSSENWDWQWHVAGLLDNQLKKALVAGSASEGHGIEEVDQGEPFSAYYTYQPSALALIDSSTIGGEPGQAGDMELALAGPLPPTLDRQMTLLVRSMRIDGTLVYQAPPALTEMFGSQLPTPHGRWVILEEPIRRDDPKAIWEAARAADDRSTTPFSYNGKRVEVRGVGFPEEHSRRRDGLGWVFVVKEFGHSQAGGQARKAKKGGDPRKAAVRSSDNYYLARAMRAGRDDLVFRAPETHGLERRRVLILGCGAVGSVLVDHLARAGIGELLLLDREELEPGNLSRHAGTFQHVGLAKSIGMAKHAMQVNPHARVRVFSFAIGAAHLIEGQTETDWLQETSQQVDLVIDATAEIGVHELTSSIAREAGTPWVMLSASPGIGGGTVVKVDADSAGCFSCFQWHQLRGTIPVAPTVEAGLVQPTGCAQPTFTGTGFDLALVSAQAARVVVGMLQRNVAGGYPEDGYQAHILTLRESDGRPIPPRWEGFDVPRHPECSAH